MSSTPVDDQADFAQREHLRRQAPRSVGVTGELASEDHFGDVMRHVVAHRESYAPREHFEKHWDTVDIVKGYVRFFERMGWRASGNVLTSA